MDSSNDLKFLDYYGSFGDILDNFFGKSLNPIFEKILEEFMANSLGCLGKLFKAK
jgi:hypothetical protein